MPGCTVRYCRLHQTTLFDSFFFPHGTIGCMESGPLSVIWFRCERALLCWGSPGLLLGLSLRLVSFPSRILVFLLSNLS
ncbi:hypothetical protein LZ32DRAFT_390419 [Colletotrichum eremochloae]|nr:hypothetical protein LZ32DRAFT_390419 [Colletotrichum eremochloae]